MVTRTVAGATREYLVLEYAPSRRGQPRDRLYVPMDQLDEVSRYVGGEDPQLDRMGGADWKARKSRARKAIREIAAELIKSFILLFLLCLLAGLMSDLLDHGRGLRHRRV